MIKYHLKATTTILYVIFFIKAQYSNSFQDSDESL